MKPNIHVKTRLANWWKTAKLTAHLMAGVPDYANYGANGGRCC